MTTNRFFFLVTIYVGCFVGGSMLHTSDIDLVEVVGLVIVFTSAYALGRLHGLDKP